jgi:cytochrome b pre-mRNA-processing protein 3
VFFKRWFGPNPTVKKGRSLYAAAVTQARNPVFYRNLAVPDTTEGRFELYSLHVVLLLHRLKGHGPQAQDIGQALFAAYVQALDSALREMGVGDLSMAKKMRKLGEAFYGRIKAYDSALLALPDQSELEAVVGRTLYADVKDAPIGLICQYAVAGVAGLSDQDITGALDPVWPPIPVAGKETV